MSEPRIRAVTFDLWDTVLVDDSDEPRRKAKGLPPKPEERRSLVHRFLLKHAPIPRELVEAAYDAIDAAFNHAWQVQHFTWTVRERLEILLAGLGRKLPEEELVELVRRHEEMELAVRPDLAPDIREALSTLHRRYLLGVVSDTVFSPGRTLRKILSEEGLLDFFSVLVFSDELGRSKPEAAIFEAAANVLDITPDQMVHVGDREQNDVDGAHRVGARAILTTVVKDRRQGPSQADAVCEDYRKLRQLLESLDRP